VRPGLGLLLLAFTLSYALGGGADEITWTRTDGATGWQVAAPGGAPPSGATPAALTAPTWFAKLPEATIPLAPTGSFELASARGKVLLLDYWASWCAPCLKELPHLERLHAAHRDDAFVALGAEPAAEFAKSIGLTMAIGLNESVMGQTMGVRTLPTLFAVDKEGRMRMRWDGYRTGLEQEISTTIDKLLADEASGSSHEIATVLTGQGTLRALWSRDLQGQADGVLGLPAGAVRNVRVVASGGDELLSFDAQGETLARLHKGSAAGRILDFGNAADDTRELVGFRPGGTGIDVIALRSGAERTIAVPAPIFDVAVYKDDAGARRIAVATMSGAAVAAATDDRAKPVDGAGGVRSVAPVEGTGVLALREGGAIGPLLGSGPAWAKPAAGAERLLVAGKSGAVTASRSVTAAVSGRFLPGEGRQLAVATYAGHLALLDEATGALQFDAVWSGVKDLAATDLDGDGRDELLVAAGRSVTALGAVSH
jgi:thiol-disulfide isomerase/thioredoxin